MSARSTPKKWRNLSKRRNEAGTPSLSAGSENSSNLECGLSAEDLAALGGRSQMLYAYKVKIQLPYWKEARIFECSEYSEEMAELVKKAK